MSVPTPLLVGLGVASLLMVVAAATAVAGRSLNRRQRRDWAGDNDTVGPDGDGAAAAVETSFIALGLARQTALVAVATQSVALAAALGVEPAWLVGTIGALLLYLLFDKLVPYRLVAWLGARRVLAAGNPLFRLVRTILWPFALYLQRTVGTARVLNQSTNGDEDEPDLGDFLDLAEEEGLVSDDDDSLLRGVADFEEAIVREVMTPRTEIVAIDERATVAELRSVFATHRFSRVPVMRDDVDHVVGIVNVKDLLAAESMLSGDASIAEIVRPVWFVPETKQVSDLLKEFQRRQAQLTIVVDEYGGTAGLVTLEDVLEEIVGEIQDESDEEEELLKRAGDTLIAAGMAEIEDIERALGRELPEGEYHTVSGMIFARLGHVPHSGESFEWEGLRIEVIEADERRIHKVRITPA